MAFDGFTNRHFEIFDLSGYQARMPVLRSEITSRLKEFGPQLAPHLQAVSGGELYVHIALHMRRTVNPPEETWAAFARSTKAYKPFVHFRVALNREGMHVKVFVEDDAEDKPMFAQNLKRNAGELTKFFGQHPEIRSYDLRDANSFPRSAASIKKAEFVRFAERLATVKGQHASFGVLLGTDPSIIGSKENLTSAVISSARVLLPLYKMGFEKGFRLTAD